MDNKRLHQAFSTLRGLVSTLRGPDGCPWDAKQTDSTVKMYLLEEAYEVIDAIDGGSAEEVCQELGDLLFQILFLTLLAQERGEFVLEDVIEKITEKMINRHPHVFGDIQVKSAKEVSDNWEKIKSTEKGSKKKRSSTLQNVPMDLPALLKAHRLSERASKAGFDWKNREDVFNKVKEEMEELDKGIFHQDKEVVKEEIGDALFSLVNLARHWDFNAENLLRDANQKFIDRFVKMEEALNTKGIELEKATTDQMNEVWDKIKKVG